MIRRLLIPALTIVACAVGAAPALADTTLSSNWSGYADHGTNVHFRTVTGRWRVPSPACAQTPNAASAMWVGIGGYSGTSGGLEQVGTEADCSAGRAVYSAWSEILPAASKTLQLSVHAGDLMQATVKVVGHDVRMTLVDLTTHRTAVRRLFAATIDTSSAEWILEAPSECTTTDQCMTLPLADFARANFTSATATTVRGLRGTVTNRRWSTTKIVLAAGGHHFVADAAGGRAASTATPSTLSTTGAFTVAYAETAGRAPGTFFGGRRVYHLARVG